MKTFAPIALFVYNRLEHTRQTIDSLLQNPEAALSKLYVFSDYAKNDENIPKIEEIRKYLKTISGFSEIHIIEREQNFGLAKSIISGVTQVLETHDNIIVLEDDLQCSPTFLEYMNRNLSLFEHKFDIFSISGYSPPIEIPQDYEAESYLFIRINSWGWATWRNRWKSVDWDVLDFKNFVKNRSLQTQFEKGGEDVSIMLMKQMYRRISSWAIRFNYAAFKQNMFTVYPVNSQILNKGADGSGVHVKNTKQYAVDLNQKRKFHIGIAPVENAQISANFKKFYQRSWIRKTINFLLKLYPRPSNPLWKL